MPIPTTTRRLRGTPTERQPSPTPHPPREKSREDEEKGNHSRPGHWLRASTTKWLGRPKPDQGERSLLRPASLSLSRSHTRSPRPTPTTPRHSPLLEPCRKTQACLLPQKSRRKSPTLAQTKRSPRPPQSRFLASQSRIPTKCVQGRRRWGLADEDPPTPPGSKRRSHSRKKSPQKEVTRISAAQLREEFTPPSLTHTHPLSLS